MTFHYPKLDQETLKNLNVVQKIAKAHPSYFITSPYSSEIQRLITEWFLAPKVAISKTVETGKSAVEDDREPWVMLYEETRDLYSNLKNTEIMEDTNTSEKMAYFRTATSLLEKLVSLQERSLGLKEVGEFQHKVMDILETVMTPAQRTQVMEKLEKEQA